MCVSIEKLENPTSTDQMLAILAQVPGAFTGLPSTSDVSLSGHWWAATRGGLAVGYAWVVVAEDDENEFSVAVESTQGCTGVGTALLSAVRSWALGQGIERLVGTIRAESESKHKALEALTAMGFEPCAMDKQGAHTLLTHERSANLTMAL